MSNRKHVCPSFRVLRQIETFVVPFKCFHLKCFHPNVFFQMFSFKCFLSNVIIQMFPSKFSFQMFPSKMFPSNISFTFKWFHPNVSFQMFAFKCLHPQIIWHFFWINLRLLVKSHLRFQVWNFLFVSTIRFMNIGAGDDQSVSLPNMPGFNYQTNWGFPSWIWNILRFNIQFLQS